MARLPRLTAPGYPHHVIQRGNNRQTIFRADKDYQFMLDLLLENAVKFDVAVHSYVLMGNHFHLLATPERVDSLPGMMQAVGRRYVRWFNDLQGRSGTLWEGRYKSTLVQTEAYLLTCMAYIDLNPVRAGLVEHVRDYPWSSHGHYIGQRVDKLVTAHAMYWALGNTPFEREAAYAQWVQQGITTQQREALTQATLKGWALGDTDFVANLQKSTVRRAVKAQAGRPVLAQARAADKE